MRAVAVGVGYGVVITARGRKAMASLYAARVFRVNVPEGYSLPARTAEERRAACRSPSTWTTTTCLECRDLVRRSAEDVGGGERRVGKRERRERPAAADAVGALEAVRSGLAKDFDRVPSEIDDPVLADAGLGIEQTLDAPVVAQRRVRDLDEERDVVRSRQPGGSIEVRSMPEQDDVRLRLRIREDRQRILWPEGRTAAQPTEQDLGQACDAGGVLDADRRHLDDLPANELDPVVLIEDSGFAHPVVLVHREPPPDYLDVRRHAVILRAPGAGASTPNVGYTGSGCRTAARRAQSSPYDRTDHVSNPSGQVTCQTRPDGLLVNNSAGTFRATDGKTDRLRSPSRSVS